MGRTFRPLRGFCMLLAMVALLGGAPSASAQRARTPQAAVPAVASPASAPAATSNEREPDDTRKNERERVDRGMEQAAPQAVGDAPVPAQGEAQPKPLVTRGPLTIRRSEFSIGVDHALSRQWVASGLLGIARTRLHRFQTELPPGALPGSPPQTSDSNIRTRSSALVGVLSYLPQPDVAYDVAVSLMQTRLDVRRTVNDLAFFDGRHAGSSWSIGVHAARVWRQPGRTVVPQVGLEYVQSDVDPLRTQFNFANETVREEGFSISRQRSRALAALAGVQLQWPRSAGFGTWSPYARATLGHRLWMRGDDVVATAFGSTTIVTDPQTITPRTTGTLASGVLLQWPGGIGAFAELGASRANGDVRETRVAGGLKFEY